MFTRLVYKISHLFITCCDLLLAMQNGACDLTSEEKLAAYSVLLPGDNLYLTPLLNAKKFRGKGNKEAAVESLKLLDRIGLGKLYIVGTKQVSTLWSV